MTWQPSGEMVTQIADRAMRTGGAVVSGVSVEQGHPVVAMVTVAGTFVYWWVRPYLRILRRSTAKRLARVLGVSLDDENGRRSRHAG